MRRPIFGALSALAVALAFAGCADDGQESNDTTLDNTTDIDAMETDTDGITTVTTPGSGVDTTGGYGPGG